MSNVMQGIFGGKKATQVDHAENKAYGYLKDTFSPITSMAGTGANAFAQLLGGNSSGFDAYKKATGFDGAAEMGSRGITGNAAANGLLRSGATGMALQNFGNTMQNQYADNYLKNNLGLAGLGMDAGKIIGGAGEVKDGSSKSSEKPGIGGFLGSILAA